MPVQNPAAPRVPPLPAEANTRDSFKFDPRPDLWKISSLQRRARMYHFTSVPMLSQPLIHLLNPASLLE
jgi:hypothetical protein